MAVRLRDQIFRQAQTVTPSSDYAVKEVGFVAYNPNRMMTRKEAKAVLQEPQAPQDGLDCHGPVCQHSIPGCMTNPFDKPDPIGLGYYESDEERATKQLQIVAEMKAQQDAAIAAAQAQANMVAAAPGDRLAGAEALHALADAISAQASAEEQPAPPQDDGSGWQ